MKIQISELEKVVKKSLINRGLTNEEIEIVSAPFIEAELSGKKTHGISKFLLIEQALTQRESGPEIIRDKFNYALVDGHKELGYITADFATDILIKKAKEYGNSMVGVVNSFYYSIANIYARKVANEGLISIILNNGGPGGVVPFGGIDPILGTNPIAIGIPTRGDPLVLDMATSEKSWGEITLAKSEERNLQDKTFLNKDGEFTINPVEVEGIVPFGGAKGYGLNLMFEIITGALVGAKMGLQAHTAYDLGFFFIAINPEIFADKNDFLNSVDDLINEIKSSKPAEGFQEVYLPGEQSKKRYNQALGQGFVEVDENSWEKLIKFSEIKTI